jgi:hypothetical protein
MSSPSDGRNNDSSKSFPMVGKPPSNGVSEEAVIFQTFMLIIRNKFIATPGSPSHEVGEDKIRRLDGLYSLSAFEAERKKLTEINSNGMGKGIAVGLLSFVFFRSGPRIMRRVLSSRSSQSTVGGGYQFDPMKSMQAQQQQYVPKPGIFLRTLKFGLDVFVSMSLAAYGCAYYTDRAKLMKDLSDIPLVEGRSLVSEELCDDFVDVYKSIPKKVWDKYDGQSEPLDAIGQFVKNCLRRKAMEKELLAERGQSGSSSFDIDVDKSKHVEIPSPGVPRDLDVEIRWIDKSTDLESEREMGQMEEDEFNMHDYNEGWNYGNEEENNIDEKRWE